MTLRPYQSDGLAEIMCAFASGARRVLYVLPTGGGKTVLFSELAQRWQQSAAIVAHRRELIRQASAKLGSTVHGVIAPGWPHLPRRLQVASIQTLARRLTRLQRFGLIILDEAHHGVAGSWAALLASQPDALVLGVTATPERLDGRGLGDVFDTLITGPTIRDLVADGYLAPSRVFAPPVDVDFRRLRMLAGDYNPAQLADAMDKPTITGDAVEHYARHAGGQPAIAFCVSVAHAEHVATEFRAAGWRSECVHGGLSAEVRDARIAGLASGAVQVLTSCDLISEGLDVPAVGAVILLRPTESLGLYLQMVGRGMRPAPGKRWLTVLDHAGNTLRHGMPDAAREWTLQATPRRERGERVPAVRQCPKCYAAHAPAPTCPVCGHVYAAGADSLRRLTAVAGELVEVTTSAAVPAAVPATALPPLAEALKSAASWDDVEAIRRERGYKPGWTAAILAHRGGRRSTRWTTATEDFGEVVA